MAVGASSRVCRLEFMTIDPNASTERPRVALVTGGARGIGHAICLALARDGLRVVSADLQHADGLRETAGTGLLKARLDVTDEAEVDWLVKLVESDVGPTEVLVNNAGILEVEPLLEATLDSFGRTFSVNCFATFHCSQAVARHMVSRGRGRIVNIASIAGKGGRPLWAAYAASKAGVISLTKSFALALAEHGVTVNAVCPGVVGTPMWDALDERLSALEAAEPGSARARAVGAIPLGREETPEDVADVVSFLASDASRYLTGQSINIDGGLLLQ